MVVRVDEEHHRGTFAELKYYTGTSSQPFRRSDGSIDVSKNVKDPSFG